MSQYYKVLLKEKHGKDIRHTMFSGNVNGHQYSAKLIKLAYSNNDLMVYFSNFIYKSPKNLAFVGDYTEPGNILTEESVRKRRRNQGKKIRTDLTSFDYQNKFLVNHTKKEYVEMNKYMKKSEFYWSIDDTEWLHPLALLTAVGNGLGGGDYYGANEEYVGTWAFDSISFEDDLEDYVGEYKKLDIWFKEG